MIQKGNRTLLRGMERQIEARSQKGKRQYRKKLTAQAIIPKNEYEEIIQIVGTNKQQDLQTVHENAQQNYSKWIGIAFFNSYLQHTYGNQIMKNQIIEQDDAIQAFLKELNQNYDQNIARVQVLQIRIVLIAFKNREAYEKFGQKTKWKYKTLVIPIAKRDIEQYFNYLNYPVHYTLDIDLTTAQMEIVLTKFGKISQTVINTHKNTTWLNGKITVYLQLESQEDVQKIPNSIKILDKTIKLNHPAI